MVVMWLVDITDQLTNQPRPAASFGSFQVTRPKSSPRLLFPLGAKVPLKYWGFSRGLSCPPSPLLQLPRRQPSLERAASSSGEAASCCRHRESVLASTPEIAQGQDRVLPSPTDREVWGESNPRFPSTPILGFFTLVWNSPISSHLSTDPFITTDLTDPCPPTTCLR